MNTMFSFLFLFSRKADDRDSNYYGGLDDGDKKPEFKWGSCMNPFNRFSFFLLLLSGSYFILIELK